MLPNAMASNHVMPSGAPPVLPKADYRNAMARLGAAVNIITTDGPQAAPGSPPRPCAA